MRLELRILSQQAPKFLADTEIASSAAWSGVVYDPLGVVLR